jgi:hypothetical protein
MSTLFIKDNKIICSIPITGATSKIRVKRRKNNFGEPISVKENSFSENDYAEWQISYFLPIDTIWGNYRKAKTLKNRESILEDLSLNYKNEKIVSDLKKFILGTNIKNRKDFKAEIVQIFKKNNETIIVKEHKNGNIYVSYELSDLFKIALQNKLITKKEIEGLINFNSKNELDIEGQYKIIRTTTNKKILDKFEFFEEKAPLFINRISANTFVEIILQHKQRAVGYQSMVYFCSKAKNLFDKNIRPIIGRAAESNEVIYLPIGKDDLIGIAESFIVASSDHAWDMKTILKDIIKQ